MIAYSLLILWFWLVTDKIDLIHLNTWIEAEVCAKGMNYLEELAETLLPGRGGNKIKILNQNYPRDIQSCFNNFFQEWSQVEEEATWQKLIDSLINTEMPVLANTIKQSLNCSQDEFDSTETEGKGTYYVDYIRDPC